MVIYFSTSFRKLAKLAYLPLFSIALLQAEEMEIKEFSIIDETFSALHINFDFEETENHLLAAYYDKDRVMSVAMREKAGGNWEIKKLPSTVGWDSHNYVDLAVDKDGFIHVSGNMHNVSLIYFRSRNSMDISDFETPGMVGNRENSVTYPIFIKMPDSSLIFQYRDGGSGNGSTIWNKYDTGQKRWTRLTESGFFDGLGQVNAYHSAPLLGPDDFFHLAWMWRETPVANTNFNLSYIRSPDLLNWEAANGTAVNIPINPNVSVVVADGVGPGNGLINMSFGVGFDGENRPILYYHKYDGNGVSQLYNTRYENGNWSIHQSSSWNSYKWDLDRQGSLALDVGAEQPYLDEDGNLLQNYFHRQFGEGLWKLNPETLKGENWEPPASELLDSLKEIQSSFPNMELHWHKHGNYYMRWETLPINQDQAYNPPYPEPSPIVLYEFGAVSVSNKKKTAELNNWEVNCAENGLFAKSPFSSESLELQLRDIGGKVLHSQNISNGSWVQIPKGKLLAGINFIQISDRKNNSSITLKWPGI